MQLYQMLEKYSVFLEVYWVVTAKVLINATHACLPSFEQCTVKAYIRHACVVLNAVFHRLIRVKAWSLYAVEFS